MARNKNSTALFDVIHSAKKPPKASPSASIPTPKWWGKNRKLPKAPVVKPSDPTESVGKQSSWLRAAKTNHGTPTATPSSFAAFTAESSSDYTESNRAESNQHVAASEAESDLPGSLPGPSPTMLPALSTSAADKANDAGAASAPKVRFIDRFKNRPAAIPAVSASPHEAPADEAPSDAALASISPMELPAIESSALDSYAEPVAPEAKPDRRAARNRESVLRVDSAAHEVRFSLSYGGLIAIGFIFVITLAIAFIAGTHTAPQLASNDLSASTQEVNAKDLSSTPPVTSGLNLAIAPVGDNKSDLLPKSTESKNAGPLRPDVLTFEKHSAKPATDVDPKIAAPVQAPPALPIKAVRTIGMIYVVVQSYPEQDAAQKVCDYLNKSGVQCTLVQGLSNWAPKDWYSVVGLQPFTKRDPTLPDYEKQVKLLGQKYTHLVTEQFEPHAYTWRDDSDLSQGN